MKIIKNQITRRDKHENNEIIRISFENNANNKNQIMACDNIKTMKFLEFHWIIMKIKKLNYSMQESIKS